MIRFLLLGLVCFFVTGYHAVAEDAQAVDINALEIGDELPEDGIYFPLQGEVPGTVNLRFIGTNLRVYFLDPEGKIMEPVFPSALVRYRKAIGSAATNLMLTTVLNAGPGNVYLTSPRVLTQPLYYRVWLVLKTADADDSAEEDTNGTQAYPMRILRGIGSSASEE
ncbi:hypothetical protein H5P28_03760 [Ruficoccus amylovorans]|uniref:DUF4384 domain-containing protein n=1 Tax=Ruficoccus amylovorans TaxID=1804625 RepID=A0A842HAR0_9BACT|nr:hypothetical protein [Ruficoccus amylovorans]MBC2593370.1 hypothetical protein [Ruficoccus amylovorans]